jgi:hypothetical protein
MGHRKRLCLYHQATGCVQVFCSDKAFSADSDFSRPAVIAGIIKIVESRVLGRRARAARIQWNNFVHGLVAALRCAGFIRFGFQAFTAVSTFVNLFICH